MANRRRQKKSQPQQVFHLFGELPTELRLEIWAHTWEPRTVSIYPINENYFLLPEGKNQLPASAYVNSESRSETLRHYKRCFAHHNKSDFRWFNFRLDTLCVAAGPVFGFLKHLDPGDLRQLQRLIVPSTFTAFIHAATPCRDTWPEPVTQSAESSIMEIILEDDFPNLKEITLTTNQWGPPVQWMSGANRKKALEGDYSKLKEVTITKNHWPEPVPDVSGDEWKDYYLFERSLVLSHEEGLALGHMRNTYINGLRVRHSTAGHKTHKQRYCCQMNTQGLDELVGLVEGILLI
ncbi:hypothetical protein F5Y08DRAFT_477 [Xylaria arbuscula]|nr:hypothetical protein F5Y08DRAFT_477 [Xylaria arbuscula]